MQRGFFGAPGKPAVRGIRSRLPWATFLPLLQRPMERRGSFVVDGYLADRHARANAFDALPSPIGSEIEASGYFLALANLSPQ
jgi:hypothetical protein